MSTGRERPRRVAVLRFPAVGTIQTRRMPAGDGNAPPLACREIRRVGISRCLFLPNPRYTYRALAGQYTQDFSTARAVSATRAKAGVSVFRSVGPTLRSVEITCTEHQFLIVRKCEVCASAYSSNTHQSMAGSYAANGSERGRHVPTPL